MSPRFSQWREVVNALSWRRTARVRMEPRARDTLRPDSDEAAMLVASEAQRLRTLPYEELLHYLHQTPYCEIVTPSGAMVAREIRVAWDDRKAQTLRVVVDVFEPQPGRDVAGSLASYTFVVAPEAPTLDV